MECTIFLLWHPTFVPSQVDIYHQKHRVTLVWQFVVCMISMSLIYTIIGEFGGASRTTTMYNVKLNHSHLLTIYYSNLNILHPTLNPNTKTPLSLPHILYWLESPAQCRKPQWTNTQGRETVLHLRLKL
jgi:hypothetical protein